jgi:hypothetical protein
VADNRNKEESQCHPGVAIRFEETRHRITLSDNFSFTTVLTLNAPGPREMLRPNTLGTSPADAAPFEVRCARNSNGAGEQHRSFEVNNVGGAGRERADSAHRPPSLSKHKFRWLGDYFVEGSLARQFPS